MKLTSDQFADNEAWIITRLDGPMMVQNESADVYVLLEAASGYVFGQIVYLGELPSLAEFNALFKRARKAKRKWPRKLLLPKEDPAESVVKAIAVKLGIQTEIVPGPYLEPIVGPLKEGFINFLSGKTDPVPAKENEVGQSTWNLLPDGYDLCPCASGKKYKFCCKVILREITEAMCAIENHNFSEAIRWLDKAKDKVGETAELHCRYAIAHSLKSEDSFNLWLGKALVANPNHPRTHYLLGIQARNRGDFPAAAASYEKAIECYPVTDKYHLNETWNNLASVYFNMGEFSKAKGGWEKALTYFPKDQVSKRNLFEFIYDNDQLSDEMRVPSPFVQRLL